MSCSGDDDEVVVVPDPFAGMDPATRALVRKLHAADNRQARKRRHVQREKKREQSEQERLDGELARLLQEEDRKHPPQRYSMSLSKEQVLASMQPCQLKAIQYVKEKAKTQHEAALASLRDRIVSLGFPLSDLDRCLTYIREDAPIVIHLREETLGLLVSDSHYRSQFETNTSGGTNNNASRSEWEANMFGHAYDRCKPFDRPKYGCLNLTGDIKGVRAAHSYGTLFMVLKSHIRHRTTFFGKDSGGFSANGGHGTLATNEYYAHVLQSYADPELKAVLGVCRIGGAASTAIAIYKEVQIHGPVCLATDIQALSVPGSSANATPAFKGTVQSFQKMTGCNVLWQDELLG